jgi:hypothetical protein
MADDTRKKIAGGWEYRVFKRPTGSELYPFEYFIGEAYLDEDGEFSGGYSDNYSGMASADSHKNLQWTVERFVEALNKPVLEVPKDEPEKEPTDG